MFAEQFAKNILQHIAALHCCDQKCDQQQLFAFEAGNIQCHQRRHMADAVNRKHDAPLLFTDAFQKARCIAGKGGQNGHGEEAVNWNEDRIEPIPVDPDQIILHRNDQQEHAKQHAVVGATGLGERGVFAQRCE